MLLDDCYASFINLSSRTDRLEHMQKELSRAGITAERFEAIRTVSNEWNIYPYETMFNRTRGAIGCWISQVDVMKKGLSLGKHPMVLEDDIVLCSDFKERIEYIGRFLENKEWDIFFLGGTVHINPPWWHTGGNNPDLRYTVLTRDAECTDDPRILRSYGAFSTHAYIVNKKSVHKIIELLDSVMHESMGIDWALIKLSQILNNFIFLPGCVKQMDNMRDIGNGMTIFSGFSSLGTYWWQDKMKDFDPSTFDFAECKNNL